MRELLERFELLEEVYELQAVLIADTPRGWRVKIVGRAFRNWKGIVPKSQSNWVGGKPEPGVQRQLSVNAWWARKRMSK